MVFHFSTQIFVQDKYAFYFYLEQGGDITTEGSKILH